MMEGKSTTSPLDELEAMKQVTEALDGLDEDSINRVLLWATQRFGGKDTRPVAEYGKDGRVAELATQSTQKFATMADLFAKCSPASDPERALLAGYWFQFVQGQEEFESQSLNTELKHLGHRVSNITSAFESLMSRKPQLVVQTRKTGSSKQARKKYKVTSEGKQAVERLIAGLSQG